MIRRGALAALAPEGTVNGDGRELLRIKSGVARIALPTGAPVIPLGIWGTQDRWPKRGIRWARPLRPRLSLAFGPPLLPLGDADARSDIDDFRARLRGQLATQVALAREMTGTTRDRVGRRSRPLTPILRRATPDTAGSSSSCSRAPPSSRGTTTTSSPSSSPWSSATSEAARPTPAGSGR